MRVTAKDGQLWEVKEDGSLVPLPYKTAKAYNAETEEEITCVIWADDATGEYERFVTDDAGRILFDFERACPRTERSRVSRLAIVFYGDPGTPDEPVIVEGGA